MLKPPCKDCELRRVACHDICPMYISYKKNKEEETKCNAMRNDTNSYVIGNVEKVRHKMRKSKYGCIVNN